MTELTEIPRIEFQKTDKVEIEFEIFTLQQLFARKDNLDLRLDKPHIIKFYHVFYITKGTGVHYIDFQPYTYSKGSLLFVSQGQVHAFEIQPGVDGILLLFTKDFLAKNMIHSDIISFSRLYNYHLHPPAIQPHETQGETFGAIIDEIQREYEHPDKFAKEEILRLLLITLLFKTERVKRTLVCEGNKNQWFLRFDAFTTLLEKHYATTRNVIDYAKMMRISQKHLNTICKSLSAVTAKEFIDNFLVLKMKRQLTTSNSSVKELTYTFGFDEPTNFVKYFKKHTGQSPAQFKKSFTK